ncbi:MAG TPA: substrate-binding domain-containing protein [Fibrobacteria bacterium]|nr:substrate-binding domain-containing protein [Fibrobacteria bacterium]
MRLNPTIRSLLVVLFAGAAVSAQVNILAASEYQPALEVLRKAFTAQTGIPTHATYGSSGALAEKAKSAGTDIFLSSDKSWADKLANSPRSNGPVLVLATAPVCIWIRGSGLEPDPKLGHLLRETPGRIALTDTLDSPDGKAAVEAMHSLVGWPEIRRRILMLPDAAEVGDSLAVPVAQPEPEVVKTDTAKDTSKAAAKDTGKTATKPEAKKPSTSRILTDAFLPQPLLWGTPIAGTGRWVPIDTSLVSPLYPSVILLKSINPSRADAAKAFLQFLQSPRGVSILRSKGFLPPPG